MGRREEAVEVLQRWVQLHPDDPEGKQRLQEARLMLGGGGLGPSPLGMPPPRP